MTTTKPSVKTEPRQRKLLSYSCKAQPNRDVSNRPRGADLPFAQFCAPSQHFGWTRGIRMETSACHIILSKFALFRNVSTVIPRSYVAGVSEIGDVSRDINASLKWREWFQTIYVGQKKKDVLRKYLPK